MFKYEKRMVSNYENTPEDIDSLEKVYVTFSRAKWYSFHEIKKEMNLLGGYDMRITSHNSMIYTCAYKYDAINPETGEVMETRLVYHTPSKRYEISLED